MIGAISDRDIAVRAVADDKDPATPVRDVMTRGICWAYEDDAVASVPDLFSILRRLRIAALAAAIRHAPDDDARAVLACISSISSLMRLTNDAGSSSCPPSASNA